MRTAVSPTRNISATAIVTKTVRGQRQNPLLQLTFFRAGNDNCDEDCDECNESCDQDYEGNSCSSWSSGCNYDCDSECNSGCDEDCDGSCDGSCDDSCSCKDADAASPRTAASGAVLLALALAALLL